MKTILRPALHTLWQSFAASIAVWWAASGATGAHAVTDVSSAQRFALSAVLASVAALLSALLHTVVKDGPAILSAEAKDDPALVSALEALIPARDHAAP